MPEFVSVTQGDQIASVTKGRAEKLGLKVVDSPATDRSGRPLPPRPAAESKAKASGGDDTVSGILAAVGDDPAKAQTALDTEQARAKPRTTLVQALTTTIEGGSQ